MHIYTVGASLLESIIYEKSNACAPTPTKFNQDNVFILLGSSSGQYDL